MHVLKDLGKNFFFKKSSIKIYQNGNVKKKQIILFPELVRTD